MTRDSLDKLKWAGWLIVGAVGLTMCGWFASTVVANSRGLAVVEERQQSQYERLREDIAELKKLVAK
jgi:hypothetical protein